MSVKKRVDVGNGLYREEENGITVYRRKSDDAIHREDGPAVIAPGVVAEYYKDNAIHRDGDKPAVIWADGAVEYLKEGRRHRDEGPAFWSPDGYVKFYKNNAPVNTPEFCGEFFVGPETLNRNLMNLLEPGQPMSIYVESVEIDNDHEGFCYVLDKGNMEFTHEVLLSRYHEEDFLYDSAPSPEDLVVEDENFEVNDIRDSIEIYKDGTYDILMSEDEE